jgi:hypothetical protein
MPGGCSISESACRSRICAQLAARPVHCQLLSIKNESRPAPCADFSEAAGKSQNLAASFPPHIKPLHLRAISAARHVAPAAVMVLAGIQKKPFAGFRRAGTNIGQLIRCQQIGRGAGDGPEQAVEVSEVVEAPLEAAVLRRRQTHVRGRGLCSGIQSGETSRRSGALVHDRPENIVNGFPQFPCVIERTLGEVGLEVAALEEAVGLRR